MIRRNARQTLGRIYWAYRDQLCRRTWSFFAWERPSQVPQCTQARINLAGRGDEAIGERMALLRGASVDQYRAWLRSGHRVLYALGPDDNIQSWMWFSIAESGPEIAPFDFGLRMRIPPGIGFLWDAFTVPAYRQRGLYKALLVRSVEECFVRGARQVWGHAQVTNRSRRVILTTELAGETRVQATRIGPVCRVSRPGFHRTLSVRDVLEIQTLLPGIDTTPERLMGIPEKPTIVSKRPFDPNSIGVFS